MQPNLPMRIFAILLFGVTFSVGCFSQNYSFNFSSTGRRVCLVSSQVDLNNPQVRLLFHDSLSNTNEPLTVSRRLLGTHTWTVVATNLPAGTGHWNDTAVALGEVWEYQVKRFNTWNFSGNTYDATGYTLGALLLDNTTYKGQMILLVADDIPSVLDQKYYRLKKELVGEGWFVNELIVPRASDWDSGNEVVDIKNQITSIYTNAPMDDKPKLLFILGHVPMPRCGSADVVAPDDHSQNKGARGCDGYYADLDGLYTDTALYTVSGLSTPLATNLVGDYKWDQDFFSSDVEMTFGRVDFANITDISTPELDLIENYLDRLSFYKQVSPGYDMGEKSAFYFGYNNSNDGSYRSLVNISKPEQVFQKTDNSNHNEWVQANGPFKVYMQNVLAPQIADWQTYGMNAAVFSSDQSYWGFGDVPQPTGVYSRIRAILGIDSKCVLALWTTTGLNIFHQACNGMPLGLALKDIINHNSTNQYLEKPSQQYDTPDWWNRTHFEIWGDPSLSLYQVRPPSNLTCNLLGNNAVLQWTPSPDSSVLGYHVYTSSSEFGQFERLSSTLVSSNQYMISNFVQGNWYMVKAAKKMESGCGVFLHPSMGISLQGNLPVGFAGLGNLQATEIFPNPFSSTFSLKSTNLIQKFSVKDAFGALVREGFPAKSECSMDASGLPNGIYFIEVQDKEGRSCFKKLIKTNGF